MCGMYGYIGTPKKAGMIYKMMKAMAVETEFRGVDSAGIAGITKDEFFCTKMAVPAHELYEKVNVKSVILDKAYFFMGHNRMASIGEVNETNAHPFLGDKYIFVHNGTVPMARKIVERNGMKIEGSTDSESLMVLVEKFGFGALKEFADLSIVAIDRRVESEGIYFYRDCHKPMVICDIRDVAGVVLFASTREIIRKGVEQMTTMNVKHFMDRVINTKENKLYRYNKNGTGKKIKVKAVPELKRIKNEVRKEEDAIIDNVIDRRNTYVDCNNYWKSVNRIPWGNGESCRL